MNFDPKRAARVGAKIARQRNESRNARKKILEDYYENTEDEIQPNKSKDFKQEDSYY
jgi:hypothetical protein